MVTYPKRPDGFSQTIDPKKTCLKLSCCDCGLVHTVDIEVLSDGKVKLTYTRDQRATGQTRRYKKG
jgi:hypothetical protein